MWIAMEHLNHAGLHDVAKQVAEIAEASERKLHEQQKANRPARIPDDP